MNNIDTPAGELFVLITIVYLQQDTLLTSISDVSFNVAME